MTRAAYLVVDLGFGDQGKGSVVDFLVRDRGAEVVVRFNGGAQAGHNVVTADGRHHTFSQFGAGTFAGASTVLSSMMVVQPWAMLAEAAALSRVGVTDVFSRTMISDACLVITPFHRAANRLKELARGALRHGSCGIGFGEAVHDSLFLGEELVLRCRDLRDRRLVRAKMMRIQEKKRAEVSTESGSEEARDLEDPRTVDIYLEQLEPFLRVAHIADDGDVLARLSRAKTMVFEGAQGVLLDQDAGFQPYTTWSRCTFDNALDLLDTIRFEGTRFRLGVLRAYATRHGAGPFPTEDPALTTRLPDAHKGDHPFQGSFRVGWFDAVAARYAIEVCREVDALAITCLDRLESLTEREWQVCVRYDQEGRPLYERTGQATHLETIERETKTRVALTSHGPTAADKVWRPEP